MINFSRIDYESFMGKFLRLPLRLLPKGIKVPIIQGPLKGYKWITDSGVHGYWLGCYEINIVNQFVKYIRDNDINVVYDIGAHVGYYSLLASKFINQKGRVYAFEPNPRNVYYIKRHLQINNIRNVKIVEAAVCDNTTDLFFDNSFSSSMGKIGNKGIQVNGISLDYFVFELKNPIPQLIKIDIEGAENKALMGAKRLLTDYKPTIFLSTHGYDLKKKCEIFLLQLGYEIKEIEKAELLCEKKHEEYKQY